MKPLSTSERDLLSSAGDEAGVAEIRRILELADPNILRLTLHHLTGDPALADMRTEVAPMWAGALFSYVLVPEHHAQVRQKAFEYLVKRGAGQAAAPSLEHATIRQTMELFGHGALSDDAFRVGVEESAFDEFPREVKWKRKPAQEVLDKIHVVVIGAGISGIAAAVHLERLGLRYTVIERQGDLGGAWNANVYPEVRVDSTSFIYQYKFEKRYPWKEFFASGGETKHYLKHCAEKYHVADKIVYDTQVESARWDEETTQWRLTLRTGEQAARELTANFVISASGLFSTPKLPDIEGIDSFRGEVLHTTEWNARTDLAGKRVAQIGTGASGAQLMPYLARHAQSVAVFQRTANWVLPMEGYRANVPEDMQRLFDQFPLYWNWFSYGMYFLNAQLEGLQEADPAWQAEGGRISARNDALAANVTGFIRDRLVERPDLIEKVLPTYPPMARRPTVDNGWYEALLRENVTLVTDGIARITPDAIVTKKGDSYACDMIVCAAGFATTRYLWPVSYVGRDGATPDALWSKDGPRAYLGMTMPGFPNFFMFYGPSSQGRSGSFHSMSEIWSRYALDAIVHVIESGAKSIECTAQAYDDYNAKLDVANKTTLWETYGKGFYYLTEQGRSVVNSPWGGTQYHAMLYQPDYRHYMMR